MPVRYAVGKPAVAGPVTLSCVARAPVAVGLNVTFTVQVLPAVSSPPLVIRHSVVSALKSLVSPPLNAIELSVAVVLPEFLIVNGCGVLVVVSCTLPKSACGGETVSAGSPGVTPVPCSTLVFGLLALVVAVRNAERAPVAVGAKTTEKVHEVPGVRTLTQSPASTME